MKFKEFFRREKHVALNAQPKAFRIAKWLIILCVAMSLFLWKGLSAVGLLFLILIILGTSFHFLLRWKSKGWTESWGPYKKIPLEDNQS